MESHPALARNSNVGPFRLLEPLGAGGMGVVYKAQDLRLDRPVALKFVSPDLKVREGADRLLGEACAAAALNHPNIATIYEVGESEHGPYIAMEFVPGETLHRRLRRQLLPPGVALGWSEQILEALAEAHERGIVHRDIKSLNVMVTPRGACKMLDFGLSTRAHHREDGHHSVLVPVGDMAIAGSVEYMAPEILRGQEGSPASDVFALGVLMYEMVAGRRPFSRSAADEVISSILNDDPAPLADDNDLKPGFARVIERCLAKSIPQRYGSAVEVLDDLRTTLRDAVAMEATQEIEVRPVAPVLLPVPMTSFVGRQDDLDRLAEILTQTRLLTITGMGGSGKTRLAIELAAAQQNEYRGGVCLVDVTNCSDESEIIDAVARVLDSQEKTTASTLDAVAARLAGLGFLLVLDNCERLIDASAQVATRLTQSCKSIRILATSRERLGVPGELTWQVPPMRLPGEELPLGGRLEDFMGYEGIRLFVDRAVAAKSGFAVSEANVRAIAEICRHLDGIALAIELAAARVRILSVEQILSRLEDRFRLLTGGSRTAPERQQTLRATVEWSVDLLSDVERELLFRLGVFSGGFTIDAAEAVGAGGPIEAFDVLDLLERLVDKSLLTTTGETDGVLRYAMANSLRAYATTRLQENGQFGQVGSRHARFYTDLAREASGEISGASQIAWLERLDREYSNVTVALDYYQARDQIEPLLELVSYLWRFWFVRGHLNSGRRTISEALAMARSCRTALDSDVLRTLHATVWHAAGTLAIDQGDYVAARRAFDQALALRRELDDESGVAESLNSLGVALRDQGEFDRAESLLQEGLEIHRRLDDPAGLAKSVHALGITAHRKGDCATANDLFTEGLRIREGLGDERGIAAFIAHLGSVACDLGQFERAEPQLRDALHRFRVLGNRRGIVFALLYRARCDLRNGRFIEARSSLVEAGQIAHEMKDLHHLAGLLEVAADLTLHEHGDDETSLRLLGCAAALRERIQSPVAPVDEPALQSIRERAAALMGGDAAGRAVREGRDTELATALNALRA